MAVPPVLPVKAAGSRWTASDYAQLAAAIDFNRNPPAASAQRSVLRTMPNATNDLLVMDGEDYDRDGIHNTGANQSQMVIRTDGRYAVHGRCTWTADSAGFRRFELRLNAGGVIGGGSLLGRDVREATDGGQTTICDVTFTRIFATGDIIEGFAYQNSGGALALDFGLRKCGIEIEYKGDT